MVRTVEAFCPRCERKHMYRFGSDAAGLNWSGGDVLPRFYCLPCKKAMYLSRRSEGNRTYSNNYQKRFFGLSESRGLSKKQKLQYDINIELMGRKFRAAHGAV